jgi:g-D-glutamyl-meso-diaminopimelate peptidase
MYTYNDLLWDISVFERMGAEVFYIGQTAAGRLIPAVHTGSFQGPQIIVQAAIHAREYMTAKIVSRQVYRHLETRGDEKICACSGVYFVPMVNIDGAGLCQEGLDAVFGYSEKKFLRELNDGSDDFTMWKANLNGVDLNTNFNAEWGTGAENVFSPASANYVGTAPESEPETKALVRLTERVRPALTLSYHSRGREIYWEFGQAERERERDRKILKRLCALTGYKAVDGTLGSAGGYKDWCIQKFKIPSFTIEAFPEQAEYPIKREVFEEEWGRQEEVVREMQKSIER